MSEHLNALSRRTFICGSAAVATALAAGAIPTQAFAVTSAEKKAEAAAALSKLEAMEGQLNAASTDFVNAEAEQLEAKGKMDEAQGRIDEANGKISDLQDQLGVRARSMYRTGSSSFLDLLLGSTSFQAFANNWGLLNDMNEKDADMVQETKDLRAEVQEQKDIFAQQEAVASEKKEQAAAAQAEAKALVDQMQSTYDSLSAEAQQLYDQEQEARAAAQEATVSPVVRNNNNGGNTSNNNGGNKKPSSNGNSGGSDKPQGGYGSSAVERAASQIGVPYAWGAGTPDVGWDCSHLVAWACGIPYDQADSMGAKYPVASKPKAGDIVHRQGHVGVYVGGDQMIHAPGKGKKVCYGSIYSPGKTTRILRY